MLISKCKAEEQRGKKSPYNLHSIYEMLALLQNWNVVYSLEIKHEQEV